MDEHTRLCVLRSQNVSVDSYSPTLIPSQLHVAVESIHQWGELGPEKKDINTTIAGDFVEIACDRFLQDALGKIRYEMAVNINSRATLLDYSLAKWISGKHQHTRLPTNAKGVPFRIVSLVL